MKLAGDVNIFHTVNFIPFIINITQQRNTGGSCGVSVYIYKYNIQYSFLFLTLSILYYTPCRLAIITKYFVKKIKTLQHNC